MDESWLAQARQQGHSNLPASWRRPFSAGVLEIMWEIGGLEGDMDRAFGVKDFVTSLALPVLWAACNVA